MRDVVAAMMNLWNKYSVSLTEEQNADNAASATCDTFVKALGYV